MLKKLFNNIQQPLVIKTYTYLADKEFQRELP